MIQILSKPPFIQIKAFCLIKVTGFEIKINAFIMKKIYIVRSCEIAMKKRSVG